MVKAKRKKRSARKTSSKSSAAVELKATEKLDHAISATYAWIWFAAAATVGIVAYMLLK